MSIALLMGIFVMYLVLVMQFGSFTAPIAIMLSLPLSLIGVVLALNLTGGTLNLMSLIGVIMLMGLVAKNAILLLDCTREEEKRGIDREEALMHAGRVRLRPILMTTFALIAGMMPVAIGSARVANSTRRWLWPLSAAPSCPRCSRCSSCRASTTASRSTASAPAIKFNARAAYGNTFVLSC